MTGSSYEKRPYVQISSRDQDCDSGWAQVIESIQSLLVRQQAQAVAIECYPGVLQQPLLTHLVTALSPAAVIRSECAFLTPSELRQKFAAKLTDDLVFGRMHPWELEDFFDPERLRAARADAGSNRSGLVVAIGVGASLILPQVDCLLYVDVARWEIQQRQRRKEIANLGLNNFTDSPSQLYKRAFFVDWRAADRLRHKLYPRVDYWIDGNVTEVPRGLAGPALRSALKSVSRRPFRVVPYFDPGVWGGQWMRHRFALPEGPSNYAWGFDCVPEENSMVLRFGDNEFELPALTLVHEHPQELLGETVYSRFGAEFPIRFDFLDTMQGGNLSLQVHPLTAYIRENFGLDYTQDESYYMLDAASDGKVFLGLREGIDRRAMAEDLYAAQTGGPDFPATKYVNCWPAAKHDHFLIPAGTIHCSGRNGVVLEISATPYIFTFKLWDWGRLGLDNKPRPIHLHHGLENIQWDRTTAWVKKNLIHRIRPIACGDGWREESTGLHELEFLETRRHWFTKPVPHHTSGNLNVLNLVEGDSVIIESPSQAFEPLTIHYAETFIVPAAVGEYTIRPSEESSHELATIKAFVRGGG
jgi:mannose-6-phosphate isomerase class I